MNLYSTDAPRFLLLAGKTQNVDQYVVKTRHQAGLQLTILAPCSSNMKRLNGLYNELASGRSY